MKTAKELALMAARALSDKKGREIQVLEIGDLTTLADYFVIATGSSNTQINALVDNVEKVMAEEAEEQPLHREGYRGGTWVLLDYGCIAVHVFNAEAREFYGLERLWRDGKPVDIATIQSLASIPALPVLQAQVLGTMLAPITGLAVVLKQIAEKQGAPAEEPAAE